MTTQMKIPTDGTPIEMFVRFDKEANRYYMRGADEAQEPIVFTPDKVLLMLESKDLEPKGRQVLQFLFDEAKKDAKGTWVSA